MQIAAAGETAPGVVTRHCSSSPRNVCMWAVHVLTLDGRRRHPGDVIADHRRRAV
jgi:hypothetical protein